MDPGSDVRYCILKEKSISVEETAGGTSSRKAILNKSSQKTPIYNNRDAQHEINIELSNADPNAFDEQPNMDAKSNTDYLTPQTDQNIVFSQPNDSKFIRKKINRFEKTLLIAVVILVIVNVLFSFIILNDFYKHAPTSTNKTDMCLTDECILVSSKIYRSLNTQVDPCDNFYEYACGGWFKQNLIPSGFPRWGILSSITYANQLIIKSQLESDRANMTEAELKAKKFYLSCMDPYDKIEKLGSKPLMDILNPIMYKSPTLQLEVNQSFIELLTFIQMEYGLNALFEFDILDDDKNSSFNNIEVN